MHACVYLCAKDTVAAGQQSVEEEEGGGGGSRGGEAALLAAKKSLAVAIITVALWEFKFNSVCACLYVCVLISIFNVCVTPPKALSFAQQQQQQLM